MNIDELVKRISKTDGLSKSQRSTSTQEAERLAITLIYLALCPGQIAVGINVSGTHVLAVSEGDIVTAFAKIVHKGRTLHTWQVDIKNTAGEVICTVQVTNYVFTPKKDNQKKGAETKV